MKFWQSSQLLWLSWKSLYMWGLFTFKYAVSNESFIPQGISSGFYLTAEQKGQLNEKLVMFRLSQSGHGRRSVGTTSLSSGITIEMINEFYEKAHSFSSVEDIEERLPVFSHNHAVAFWNTSWEPLRRCVNRWEQDVELWSNVYVELCAYLQLPETLIDL